MPELVLLQTFSIYSIKTTKLECDENKYNKLQLFTRQTATVVNCLAIYGN